MPSGAPDYFISVIEDISRRKQAEETLVTAEARLRAFFESSPIAIVIGTPTGQMLDANAAALTLFGCTKEEVMSGQIRWADMTAPEFRQLDAQNLAQIRAGGTVPPWEKEYVLRNGRRLPTLVGVSLVKGATDVCMAFVVDLSERRRLEEQLKQAQRMELIGQLAGGVAHDFNNLLTPIIGYSAMVRLQLPGDHPACSDVEEIQKAGQRAAALTRQLLAFSRKQVLQPRVCDLNGLTTEATRLLQRLLGEHVQLVLALSSGLWQVKLDPGQFEQVLMNLAVNARDAMPERGKLTIETANVDLRQEYASAHADVTPGAYVLLAVSDTGTGMSKEVLAHLFEPFFTTKERGRGTGLGLATVHGIVKQSRGHIYVYSELGLGTTFKIYFPASVEEDGKDAEALLMQQPDSGTETLLLVEDEDALRVMAAKLLRSKGYTVLEAENGARALAVEMDYTGSIELLITDVIMPGMSGRDAALQITARRPAIKVLYISGYTENSIAHHGVLDEGTALLEKPFTPDGLTCRVRSILDQPGAVLRRGD